MTHNTANVCTTSACIAKTSQLSSTIRDIASPTQQGGGGGNFQGGPNICHRFQSLK